MVLPSSGNSISLDQMHVEVGGTTGTTCSLNDSDIRSIIDKGDGASSSFQEFLGQAFLKYIQATGGTPTVSGNYTYRYFTSSGTLQITQTPAGSASATVDYIVIGGGGAGGWGGPESGTWVTGGGGGGAGGYITGSFNVSSTGSLTVTVGGGASSNNNAGNKSGT